LVVITVGSLLYVAKDFEQKGSFAESIQIILGLKNPDSSPKPEDTLVAPFAEASVKPVTNAKERSEVHLPVNKIPLDQPHRSVRAVSDWLTQNIGNALVLDKKIVSNINTAIKPYFNEKAFGQYTEFGKKSNIFSAVFHGENTTMSAYLKEAPLFMSAGPVNGVYEWTYEMSIVLSLVKGELKQYKTTTAEQQLKDVYFCISAQRSNEANEDGLLISSWKTGNCK
jgi:hypothetical protein